MKKIDIQELPQLDILRKELKRERYKRRFRRLLRSTVNALIVVAAVAALIATLVLPVLQIEGTSMEPTMKNGDIVLLTKTQQFDRGEICGFAWNNKLLIKRVIGIAGDWIEIDTDGSVYLNGEYWYDSYMLECFDSQYFRQHFRIDPVDMVKHGSVDEETSVLAEGPEYMEFMQWVSSTDFSDDSEFEQLQKEVDLQSYIDFIAINYLLSNVDFCDDKNSIMWRSANISSASLENFTGSFHKARIYADAFESMFFCLDAEVFYLFFCCSCRQ